MRREREDKEGRTALRNGGADSVNTRRAPTHRLSQGGREVRRVGAGEPPRGVCVWGGWILFWLLKVTLALVEQVSGCSTCAEQRFPLFYLSFFFFFFFLLRYLFFFYRVKVFFSERENQTIGLKRRALAA